MVTDVDYLRLCWLSFDAAVDELSNDDSKMYVTDEDRSYGGAWWKIVDARSRNVTVVQIDSLRSSMRRANEVVARLF